MIRTLLARLGTVLAILVVTWLAASCGGGDFTLAGVGTGGTGNTPPPGGVGLGVTTGFGSVIVDGIRYDDSSSIYLSEEDQGLAAPMASTGAMLGQSMEFEYDAKGAMTSIMVSPELLGTVSAVAANSVTVLGMKVPFNTDASQGPVTALLGYAAPSAIQVGDRVAVYGLLKTDSGGAAYVQATLVAQKHSGAGVRLAGYVSQFNAGAGTLVIGPNTIKFGAANISPAGAVLANGALVSVWSEAEPSGNVISANNIRIKGPSALSNMTLSGAITNFVSAANFKVRNMTIDAGSAAIAPSGSTLSDGKYVVVVGSFDPASNKLTATGVTIYAPAAATAVELHGSILNFVSIASFTVRGVVVDASTATIVGGNAAQLVNGAFVEVTGALNSSMVKAATVTIVALTPLQAPMGATLDLMGTITAYNPMTGSYTLTTTTGATVDGILGGSMMYSGGSAASIAVGQAVNVRGSVGSGTLRTTVMSFMPSPSTSGSGGSPGPVATYMEGIAYNVTATSFMLNGLTIQRNGVAVQGSGMMGNQGMMPGSRIGATVQFTGGQYVATSITVLTN